MEEKKNKKSIFQEFREFITRGNVIDLAVGVIIGGAFTAIVTALTSQILQPFINYLISLCGGDKGLESARTILGTPVYTYDEVGAITGIDWSKTNFIDWGAFISAIINFFLVALILFLIVKGINSVRAQGQLAKDKIAAEAKKLKSKNDSEEETPKEE